MTFLLLMRLTESYKDKAINISANFEHRLQEGSKSIYHLEGFVENLMYIQNQFSIEVLI